MGVLLDYVKINAEKIEPKPGIFEDLLFECPLLHELHGGPENKRAGFQSKILRKPSHGQVIITRWNTNWEYQIGLNSQPGEPLSDELEFIFSFYTEGFVADQGNFYDAGIDVIKFRDRFFMAELVTTDWRVVFSLISEQSARHIAENFVSMFLEEKVNRSLSIDGISDFDRYQACMNYLNRTNFKPFRDAEAIESIVADTPSLKGRNRVSL